MEAKAGSNTATSPNLLAKLVEQGLKAVRSERRFEKEYHRIQPDQEVGHIGCAEAGLIIAQGNHGGSNNLVIWQWGK
jgi:hypothetical protein